MLSNVGIFEGSAGRALANEVYKDIKTEHVGLQGMQSATKTTTSSRRKNTDRAGTPPIQFENLKTDGPAALPPDLLEKLIAWQRELQKTNTEVEEATAKIDTAKSIYVAFPGDKHFGNTRTQYLAVLVKFLIMRFIPRLYPINGGDTYDNFLPSKHPEGSFEMIVPPSIQKMLVEQVCQGMRGRWLATIMGDHENFSKNADDFDFNRYLGGKLFVPNLGWGGFINLTVGNQTYRICARHRYRFNSSLNLTHPVKRMRDMLGDFDIGVIWHGHQADTEHLDMADKDRVFIRGGTAKLADNFAKRLGFTDGKSGWVVPAVKLWPDQRKIKVYFDITEILDELPPQTQKKIQREIQKLLEKVGED